MNMPPTVVQSFSCFFDAALGTSSAVIYATDAGWWRGRLHYMSHGAEQFSPVARESLYATPRQWLAQLTTESCEKALAQLEAVRHEPVDRITLNYTLVSQGEGTPRHLQDDIVIHRDGDNEIVELVGSIVDVTERQTLLERFEKLSEQLPGALYQCRMAPGGGLSFTLVSSGAYRLFGLTPAQLLANAENAIDRVHPDDMEKLWRSIRRSALRLSVWRCEFRYNHPDGQQLWVSGHATPQREDEGSILWHGFCEDVTLRKQAQLALAENERRYRFIVENVSDLILLMDSEGVCQFVSPSIVEVLGYEAEELRGHALIELLPPDDAPRIQRRIHEASRQGSNLQIEMRTRHEQGHYIWLEISCSPYVNPANNRYEWVLGVMRDITRRKLREMKLHELSTTDSLTGALNRGAFLNCLTTEVEASSNMPARLSLVVFDIDNFKTINDTWGHAAGDLVLASLGDICRGTLRSHDVFGRIGGEEFALVLSGQSLNEAAMLAERLRKKFENVCIEFYGQWLNFTVSFGIAERKDGEGLDDFMHRADMGLYAAKHEGRNRVQQAPHREG